MRGSRRRVTQATPRVRGGLGFRLSVLCVGLFVFASGSVAMLDSRLGLSPWNVLHQGLARQTPLSFGEANICVAVVVVAIAWSLGAPIGLGTVANAVLVGTFVQLLTSVPLAGFPGHSLAGRIALLAAGVLLTAIGTGLYVGAGLGAGPRDSLMITGARRAGFRIGVVRAAMELSALISGFLLGGTVGVGTLAFMLAIGPTVELAFWLLAHSPIVESSTGLAPLGSTSCLIQEVHQHA